MEIGGNEMLKIKQPFYATIDELASAGDSPAIETPEVIAEETQPMGGFKIDLSFLRTPTGEGSVDDYLDHTLNFNRSKGMARIIRGMTGFAGNLNLAIVDIFLGIMELRRGAA